MKLWQQSKPLCTAAQDAPEAERANLVSDARANQELRGALVPPLRTKSEQTNENDPTIVNSSNLARAETRPFSVGELVMERFKILRHLGAGGMGDVYEAMDLELGRIALKTIRSDIVASPETLIRFKKEVLLARKISGPHVCRIHEWFMMAGDAKRAQRAFLTMEFLDGVTLADKIRQAGPLPWREAKTIALEICAGLQTIHEAGIVHRDLKCRNIMLTSRNGCACAVLMDFGLAQEFSSPTSETAADVTRPGLIAGTPDYMAPEQFTGKELTPATDIYALGVVLYELVTGKHPFAASTMVGAVVLRGKRPPPASSIQSGLPRHCDEIICKCLEFDAENRYRSATELADTLRSRTRFPEKIRKHWLKISFGAATSILLFCGLLLIPAIRERLQGALFSSSEKHIAVLPFDSAGGGPDTEALGDGMMDSLAGKLSNLETSNQALWVVPASEVRHRKVSDPSSALKQLGASLVVIGRLERHDQTVHLSISLVDTRKMRQIGFAELDSEDGDLDKLQNTAVIRLSRLMNVSINSKMLKSPVDEVSSSNYEKYLTSLGYLQRYDRPANLDAAIRILREVVDGDDRFALGFAQLGEAYRLKYQMDQDPKWLEPAQKYCEKAIELDTSISAPYITLANIHELTGKHDLAIYEFLHATSRNPKDAEALKGLAHAYERSDHLQEAETTFQKAAALQPDYWDGYDELGNFYDRQGKFSQAVEQYKRAAELTPDNAQVYANLGATYVDLSDPKLFPEAEKTLNQSIALGPSYAAYANLGALYGFQSRYAEAAIVTEKALQMVDHDYRVWGNLVIAYEWLNEKEKADSARKKMLDVLEKTVKLDPRDAEAQSTLAVIYASNRTQEKAVIRIRTSLALAPDNPVVLCNVADAYELLGDHPDASRYVQKAIHKGVSLSDLRGDPYLRVLLAKRDRTNHHT